MITVVGNKPIMRRGDNEIGVVGDNLVKTLEFSIDRIQGAIDLNDYSAWALIERSAPNGGASYSTMVTKATVGDKITISLPITANETKDYGYIYASIRFATSNVITSFSDYDAEVTGTVKATSTAHGLDEGVNTGVVISGTTNYNGVYDVTWVDVDNFYFSDTWVSDQTGWWGVSPIWQTERVLLKVAKGINGETEAEVLEQSIFDAQIIEFQNYVDEIESLFVETNESYDNAQEIVDESIYNLKIDLMEIASTTSITGINRVSYSSIQNLDITATGNITVLEVGKNIFDGNYESKYITASSIVDGVVGTHFTTTMHICGAGIALTVSGSGTNRSLWRFYNSAGTYISYASGASVTSPALSAYFQCYYRNGSVGGAEVQIEIGSSATAYEAYIAVTKVDNTTSCAMFELPIGDSLTFSGAATIGVYDYSHNIIDERVTVLESLDLADNVQLLNEISEDLMVLLGEIESTGVNRAYYSDTVELDISAESAITVKKIGKNIFDGTYEAKYLTPPSTTLTAGTEGTHFTSYPIVCGAGITLTVSGNGTNRTRWCFYDSSLAAISSIDSATVTTPTGTVYFRCYYRNGATGITGTDIQIEISSNSTAYEAYAEELIIDNNTSVARFRLKAGESLTLTDTATLNVFEYAHNNLNDRVEILETLPYHGVKIKRIDTETTDYFLTPERVGASIWLTQPDFDDIYPWSAIRLCNIDKHASGADIIVYDDDASFALDGTNGSVMVEIPKHYVKRYISGGYEYRYISGTPQDGFILDPSFIENGKELNAIYVSAYEGYVDTDKLVSYSGVCPTTDITMTQLRDYAKENGDGYGILDLRTLNTIQNLFMIEYASKNSQTAIGNGWGKMVQPGNSYGRALTTPAEPNTIVISGATTKEESYFFTGASVCFVSYASQFTVLSWGHKVVSCTLDSPEAGKTTIVFDGAEVFVTTDYCIGNAAQYTGISDDLTTPSGKTVDNGTDSEWMASYRNSVRYRYIENLWGNMWHWLDGINLSGGFVYVCDSMKDYETAKISSPYRPLPVTPEVQDSNASTGGTDEIDYVKDMFYSPSDQLLTFPISRINADQATVPISETTPHIGSIPAYGSSYGDYYYFADDGDSIVHGGGFDHYYRGGLFCLRMWMKSTEPDAGLKNSHWYLYGARLIYKPIGIL